MGAFTYYIITEGEGRVSKLLMYDYGVGEGREVGFVMT